MTNIKLPSFQIIIDKKFDTDNFIEFFNVGNPMIKQIYPNIITEAGVITTIENNYRDNQAIFENTSNYLKDNIPTLTEIAAELSDLLDCNWDGIDLITIIPSVCPVCPRFIEDSKFLLTFNFDKDSMLRICAHEMTHFLYFKKLRELFPNDVIDTEYPSKDWLVSEIVAPIIVNNKNIQALIDNNDEFFSPEGNIINSRQIKKITELFNKEPNLGDFRRKASSDLNMRSNSN